MVQQPDSWRKDVSRAYALLASRSGSTYVCTALFAGWLVSAASHSRSFRCSKDPIAVVVCVWVRPCTANAGSSCRRNRCGRISNSPRVACLRVACRRVAHARLNVRFCSASGLANRRDSADVLFHLLSLARRSPGRPVLLGSRAGPSHVKLRCNFFLAFPV
jgi:hypothetical protein